MFLIKKVKNTIMSTFFISDLNGEKIDKSKDNSNKNWNREIN